MTDVGWSHDIARERILPFVDSPGGLLPALRALQSCFGCIDARAVELLAEIFNLSRTEVHGVVSFYHDFRSEPPGRHIIRVCQAESCQAMGSRQLTDAIKRRLNVELHETTPDGEFTLEPVYCLGNCACSPALMIDDQNFGRIDEGTLDTLLMRYRADQSA